MATAAVGFLIGLFNKSFIDSFNAFSLISGVLILGILKYLIFAVLYLLSARKIWGFLHQKRGIWTDLSHM